MVPVFFFEYDQHDRELKISHRKICLQISYADMVNMCGRATTVITRIILTRHVREPSRPSLGSVNHYRSENWWGQPCVV